MDANGRPILDTAALVTIGAVTPVEVHVAAPVAQALAQANTPLPQPQTGLALVDTGATFTCVHEPLLINLTLQPINVIQTFTANGAAQCNVYAARLNFPGLPWDVGPIAVVGVDMTGQTSPASHGQQAQPIVALIGRDLLQLCSLTWNGPTGHWSISW